MGYYSACPSVVLAGDRHEELALPVDVLVRCVDHQCYLEHDSHPASEQPAERAVGLEHRLAVAVASEQLLQPSPPVRSDTVQTAAIDLLFVVVQALAVGIVLDEVPFGRHVPGEAC